MVNTDTTGEISGHSAVIAVPGSPPWFSCRRCGAYRSTHAGLADLPCEPDRYNDITPSDRVSAGEILRARVDQVLGGEDRDRVIMGHADESGVRFVVETNGLDIVRGDEVEVRFEGISGEPDATILRVVSTDNRVPSPTLTYVGSDGESTADNSR